MPRRLIQRYLPAPETLHSHKSLRFMRHLIGNPLLWQVSRQSVGNAFMVGLFCALLPIPGQMLVAAFGAWLLRCNLPLAVALVWVTNPLTMPVVFYMTYMAGTWLLNTPPRHMPDHLSAQWFATQLADIMPALFLGSLVCAITIGLTSNILIRLLWRWHIMWSWHRRQKRRQRNQAK
ncbi:DUF2062 domain-containing protein [Phytohalomonas tamaricis]|uniref:DUF2062 domain-containing protein n=1 Tax=Phytohalomonas tamaricis TaxID=2081032 RepID=UPI000D0BB43A|nr:DUF2062 domain-containing protein [Phytohalomonas tamaricis]